MQDRNVDFQEGTRLRNVRRRLFQDDSEEIIERRQELNSGEQDNFTNQFYEEARRCREEAKKRWNFDFEKEKPLPGRYQWIKVDEETSDNGTTNGTQENGIRDEAENQKNDENQEKSDGTDDTR